jgi:hypothetical protein
MHFSREHGISGILVSFANLCTADSALTSEMHIFYLTTKGGKEERSRPICFF